jgi:predicted ATPase
MTADPAGGLRTWDEGSARLRYISVSLDEPFYACMGAEALAAAGHPDKADELLANEASRATGMGMRFWLSELHRMRAELSLAHAPAARQLAASMLKEAAAVASEQDAPMLALRVAMVGARLAVDQDGPAAGGAILQRALARVGEDDGGAELARARALLHAWRQSAPETADAI